MSVKTAICLLLINKIEELPSLAIASLQENSDLPIYVGYLNENDIYGLPKDTQISYVQLENVDHNKSKTYQEFGSEAFYETVIKKWVLFEKLINLNFECVIYCDLDVVWVRNASVEVLKTFENRDVEILVQSISQSPAHPALCMGFFAFKVTDFTRNFIARCFELQSKYLAQNEFIGDDEVVTELYAQLSYDSRILELPQTTFPVGHSIGLFRRFGSLSGIAKISPYIFHANYVIGANRKRILLRNFLGTRRLKKLGFSRNYFLLLLYVSDTYLHLVKTFLSLLKSSLLKVCAKNLSEKK